MKAAGAGGGKCWTLNNHRNVDGERGLIAGGGNRMSKGTEVGRRRLRGGDLKVHSPAAQDALIRGQRETVETGRGKSWVPGENLNMPAKAVEN